MFNVLTIAREYGSGGAEIGRKVAELLGWACIDKQIIERVAAMEKVDISWVAEEVERSSAWWERVMKGFRHGGPELYVGELADSEVDHDTLQQVTQSVIQEAAKVGRCVIIGRGSHCVLQHHPNVLRVLVFAPLEEKLERIRLRHPYKDDLEALQHRMDSDRIRYAQTYYRCDSSYPGLYHLCLNSTLGIAACVQIIVQTIQSS